MKRDGRHRKRLRIALSLVLVATQLLAFAAVPVTACDRSQNATVLAHLGGSTINKVVVSGNYAFAAANGSLIVFDVSDPVHPKVAAEAALSGNAEDIAIDGGFAYVVGDWGDMQIVDVTNPAAPFLRGKVGWGGAMHGVAVLGTRAYVTSDGHGFKVCDIADKDNPYLVTYVGPPTNGQFRDISIVGTKAYVSWGVNDAPVNKIRVFNIAGTIPATANLKTATTTGGGTTAPSSLGDYAVPGTGVTVRSLAASGSLVYAAEGARGLEIVDFGTVVTGAQKGKFDVVGAGGFDVAVDGATVYLAAGDAGLKIIDATDPAAPVLLGTLAGTYTAVAAAGGKACLGSGKAFAVADVSVPAAPVVKGTVAMMPADAKDVCWSGGFAYLAAGTDGLVKVSYDATTAVAKVVGSYGPLTDATKVAASGGYAYVADGSLLKTFDVSGDAPALVSSLSAPGIECLFVDGARLYSAEGSAGLAVYGLSQPGTPTASGRFDFSDRTIDTHAVVAEGDRVFIGIDGAKVVSLNAANPAAITERDRASAIGDVLSLSLDGDYLWAGTTEKVFKFNAGDPAALAQIGKYKYVGKPVRAIAGRGGYAYAATDAGFFLFDFSDAAAEPYEAMNFGKGSMTFGGLELTDDGIYLAAREAGLYLLDVPVLRTSGPTRYDTAVEMSKSNWESADDVVLATGANYADAACAAPLAHALDAPLLLVHPAGVTQGVLNEITRLSVAAGGIAKMRVTICGSDRAVPGSAEAALRGIGVQAGNIKRLAGTDRYDTARLIALDFKTALGKNPTTAFVATGDNFPDALTVSGVAAAIDAPVLLVRKDVPVPQPTINALTALGSPKVIAVGSEMVISKAVYDQLKCVDRLYGPTRYETAKDVADYGLTKGFDASEVIVTCGTNFPDALVAGVVSAKHASPILLTNTSLPTASRAFISSYKSQIEDVTVVGSSVAVPQAVEDSIVDLIAQ